jgi:hypothetical protein
MRRRGIGILASLAIALSGCDALQPDTASLGRAQGQAQVRPRCDACHGYAPHTGAHRYHMDTTLQVSYPTAGYGTAKLKTTVQITCADCHAASIAFHAGPWPDTVYQGTGGAAVHTQGWPWIPFDRASQGTFSVTQLDSVPWAFASREAGAENPFWITRSAPGPGQPGHANGAVDVVFPERDAWWTDPTDGSVHRATWDPVNMSCSAVGCHGSNSLDAGYYTWRSM